MALTNYPTGHALAVKLWARKLFVEVLQEAIVAKFVGKTPSSMIQIKDETTKSPGDKITVGLRMQLDGDGVQGDGTLENNEEELTTHNDAVLIDQLRHAVRSKGKMSEQRVPFDVREEAKSGLVDWWTGRLDESFLNALCGNTAESDTKRTGNNSATAPDSDHIKRKNDQSDDQSLVAADTFTIDLLDSGVERARTLEPGIRPIKQSGGEYFVAFLHPYQVTDLRQSTTTGQFLDIQKAAMQGGMVERNPLFTGALA